MKISKLESREDKERDMLGAPRNIAGAPSN